MYYDSFTDRQKADKKQSFSTLVFYSAMKISLCSHHERAVPEQTLVDDRADAPQVRLGVVAFLQDDLGCLQAARQSIKKSART